MELLKAILKLKILFSPIPNRLSDPAPCVDEAECSNFAGGYYCDCGAGYEGDGKVLCQNIDECGRDIDTCHWNATCTDTDGGFGCECVSGYTGLGVGDQGNTG